MSNIWITVRMDDGGIVAATLHASEEYPHPHADYRGADKPNPSTHVAVEVEAPAALQEALQAAIDGAREQLEADVRIAAMRATVRAVDRPSGPHEIAVGGSTEPTGDSPEG